MPLLTLVRTHYHTNCEQSSQAAIYRAARCIGDKTSARPNRLCPCERSSLSLSLSFSHSRNGNPSLRYRRSREFNVSPRKRYGLMGGSSSYACSLDRRRGRIGENWTVRFIFNWSDGKWRLLGELGSNQFLWDFLLIRYFTFRSLDWMELFERTKIFKERIL